MADFYADMAKTARDLLAPTSQNGLGQGKLELTRVVPGVVDPSQPWIPVEPTTTTQPIRGAVRGISKQLVGVEVGGIVLMASDRVAVCETPVIPYEAGDVLVVDDVPVMIIAFEKLPAAGIAAAVKFTIRG